MKSFCGRAVIFCLFVGTTGGRTISEEIPASGESATHQGSLDVGVAKVDITPAEEITLAGSPSPKKTSSVDTPLFVKALVVSAEGQSLAIVTLDTLKYPANLALQARRQIEETTGIPAGNVIISTSHTHYGPLWSYYPDRLVTSIGKAVALAARDLAPCAIGVSKGEVEGLTRNRRVLKAGQCWNRWLLKPSERDKYPPAGLVDPELTLLAVTAEDGRYKALLYGYACHAANTRTAMISADYPGRVQRHVEEHLGYQVPTLFLPGACGDVNPDYNQSRDLLGEAIGKEILKCLNKIEFIDRPAISIETREIELPGRENPTFKEAGIALKWNGQLEHYRKSFAHMKERQKPAYDISLTGITIGDRFAIITNPSELFCEIGMTIKAKSPFKNTIIATLTNGACGYVPTAKAFDVGGYETWYGEHSFLTTRAGEMIEAESLNILQQLRKRGHH